MSRNLAKCLRCGKVLIQEEQADHVCTPSLKGVIHLDIDYIVETRRETGEQLFMAKGLDGYLYRLTKKTKQTFMELSDLPTNLKQSNETTKDGTKYRLTTLRLNTVGQGLLS